MFRAFDQQTERLVAIKLFTHDLAPERVHQLVAELERLIDANLAHPGIAAPLAAGIHDNRAYLAMEYVSADSLDTAIRQYGAAPPADALRVAAQLAGALDFAAVVHVAHGALHPRDVLLSVDETRLTGLGIAAAFERIQIAAPVRRPYTAPEGIAGADWDRRADVFSLAALMHELLWGRRVSATGAQAGAALTQIAGGDLVALRAVFARALAERPADRFDTALEFAQALTMAFPDAAHALPASDADGLARRAASPAADAARAASDARLPLDEPSAAAAPPVAPAPNVRLEPPALVDSPPPAEEVRARTASSAHASAASDDSDAEAPDFHFRETGGARYQDVDTAHALPVSMPAVHTDDIPAVPPLASASVHSEPPVSALDRSRSAIWPLALALLVGIAIGFAGGYGVGNRDRGSSSAQATAAVQPADDATSTAGREPGDAAGSEQAKAGASKAAPPIAPSQKPDAPGSASPGSTAAARSAEPPAPAPTEPGKSADAARSSGANRSEAAAKSDEAAPSAGRLLVRSTPAGARVFVDGRDAGRTPVAVRDLAHGEHRVRLVRDGYGSEERRVTISASRPAQSITVPLSASARLAPVPAVRVPLPATPGTTGRFVGALSVDSRPNGAKVFIDGKLAGTTPLQVAGLDAGEHVVRIERDGYRRWSSSVRVVASEQNRVTASLEK